MKHLLIILSLLPCVANGQFLSPGIDWSAVPAVPQGPAQIIPTNMIYFWNSDDLPIGAFSSWTDRISASVWTNGNATVRPTNSASGPYFNNSSTQFLTNSGVLAVNASHKSLYFFVFKAHSFGGSLRDIVGDSLSSSTAFISFTAGGTLRAQNGAQADGFLNPLTDTFYDVAFFQYQNSQISTNDFYTNGVLALHQYATDGSGLQFPYTPNWKGLGFAANGYYDGYLPQLVIWTNVDPDPAQVTALHNWATNKYGYTP